MNNFKQLDRQKKFMHYTIQFKSQDVRKVLPKVE